MMRARPGSRRSALTAKQRAAKPPVSQPIFRTHPITGRTVLYCNPGYAMHIDGMPRAESDELLDFLFAHQELEKYFYAHQWAEGDVLMWDNIGTVHNAVLDYRADEPRYMRRVQVMATKDYARRRPERAHTDPSAQAPLARAHSHRRKTAMARTLVSSGSSFETDIGYSRAVVDGDWIFVSGTTGFDYATMTISEDVVVQCRQAMLNVASALSQAGGSIADIVRVRYILPKREDFEPCWPVLKEYFGNVRPAATMIQAGLSDPRMKIEIEVTARRRAD